MKVETNTVVALHYKVTTEGGEPRDSSGPDAPVEYLHGHGQMVPGLEVALLGRRVGDDVTVTLSPEEGYGVHDPELDLKIPTDRFPDDMLEELQPGYVFGAEHPEDSGVELLFTVVALENDDVLVSANHPLSGETLVFDVSIVGVRAATEEELEHGHAHGPHGHDHGHDD